MTVHGASPFPANVPRSSLDVTLEEWCRDLEVRFPSGQMAQANGFNDVIPHDWEHLFAGHDDPNAGFARGGNDDPLSRYGPAAGGHGTPPREQRGGNARNPESRASRLCLFEKKSSHQDHSRGRGTQFTAAVRPFPHFVTASGESVEICFGYACSGGRCSRTSCNTLHLTVTGTRMAPQTAWVDIRKWLTRPEVAARVSLTPEARRIPGLGL